MNTCKENKHANKDYQQKIKIPTMILPPRKHDLFWSYVKFEYKLN